MRKRRIVKLTALWMVMAAPLAAGGTFRWVGDGVDDFWNNGNNWECVGKCCVGYCTFLDLYPSGPRDDAWFPLAMPSDPGAPQVVELSDETIDSLTLEVKGGAYQFMHVQFQSQDTSNTLTCDNIRLDGGNGDVKLTVTDDARVVTVD